MLLLVCHAMLLTQSVKTSPPSRHPLGVSVVEAVMVMDPIRLQRQRLKSLTLTKMCEPFNRHEVIICGVLLNLPNACGSFKARCATVASRHCLHRSRRHCPAMHSNCGNPLTPKLPSRPSRSGDGRVVTAGMVTMLSDAPMGNPQPSP